MQKFDGVFREEPTHESNTWIVKGMFNRPMEHHNDPARYEKFKAANRLEEVVMEMTAWMALNSEGTLKFDRLLNFSEKNIEIVVTLTFRHISELISFAMEFEVKRNGIGNTVSCLPDILQNSAEDISDTAS